MELETQKYFRSGKTLEDIEREFAIKTTVSDELGVVALNYNQVASPMDQRIPQECRALILELGTWNVASRSFFKFFNYGEPLAALIDWSTAVITEKMDGSLVSFYHHRGEWRIATKGTPDASGQAGRYQLTFRNLILLAIADMGYSLEQFTAELDPALFYAFELVSTENRVIIPYDKRELVWLAAWNSQTLEEVDVPATRLPTRTPKTYVADSLENLLAAADEIGPFELEGYVVKDAQYRRIKVKTPAYLLADRVMATVGTARRKIEFVLSPDYDDLFSVLPTYIQEELSGIAAKVRIFAVQAQATFDSIQHLRASRKDFALEAVKHPYKSYLFMRLDGAEPDEALRKINSEHLARWIGIDD